MHKNNRQNSENNIFTKNGIYGEKYTAGHLCTEFEEFILIYEAMIAKQWFDLLLAVSQVKMILLWCNSNWTCRATYWMYIPSFKLISQSMLKKSPENADGQTDGRTLPWHNTSRFSNGRIKIYCLFVGNGGSSEIENTHRYLPSKYNFKTNEYTQFWKSATIFQA